MPCVDLKMTTVEKLCNKVLGPNMLYKSKKGSTVEFDFYWVSLSYSTIIKYYPALKQRSSKISCGWTMSSNDTREKGLKPSKKVLHII